MSWALHKAVSRKESDCPVKVAVYLEGVFAADVCKGQSYTKDTTFSFSVRNWIVTVQSFPCGEILCMFASFHLGKAVANARAALHALRA